MILPKFLGVVDFMEWALGPQEDNETSHGIYQFLDP